ncbi:MAG: hypothetical protein FJ104_00700 [Deltaproteobacteria bacterium]|nr:hypothetical protein [Deltaproteobacteria bacterium]
MNAPSTRFRALAALAAVALLVAAPFASAAGKKKAEPAKPEEPARSAGMMEGSGKDPATTEGLDDDGAFVPGRKKTRAAAQGIEEGDEAPSEQSAEASPRNEQTDRSERDKPKPAAKPRRKTAGVFVDGVAGFGGAPLPGPSNPGLQSTTTLALIAGGHFDVAPDLRIAVRLPWTTTSAEVEGEDSRAVSALGNPELTARLRFASTDETEWSARLGIGIPVAQGSADITAVQSPGARDAGFAQRLGDAATLRSNPELYAPETLPVTPGVGVSHRAGAFRAAGDLKVAFLPALGGRVQEPDAGNGTYSLSKLGMFGVLGGSASYEVVRRTHVALAAWATYAIAEQLDYASDATSPSGLQLALEPRVLAQFGRVLPSLGLLVPLGGPLADAGMIGVRARVDVVF